MMAFLIESSFRDQKFIVGLNSMKKVLTHRTEIAVRFNEADPLGIVWHGHYIRYFEDGREAFGEAHGCRYLDFYKSGYVVPVVNVNCNYKKSLKYGDRVIIETTYKPTKAAKMIFDYILYNAKTGDVVATGNSVQVFLDREKSNLQLIRPSFFDDWLKEKGLL